VGGGGRRGKTWMIGRGELGRRRMKMDYDSIQLLFCSRIHLQPDPCFDGQFAIFGSAPNFLHMASIAMLFVPPASVRHCPEL